MGNLSLISTLLHALCWISLSVCEFHTVKVHPGEEVKLWCSNLSSFPSHIFWFKMTNKPNASCISSMLSSESNVSLREGFKNGKFAMASNTTIISLRIKEVNISDAGLYFCGENISGNPRIFSATCLWVEDDVFNQATHALIVILSVSTAFFMMVVLWLVVKTRSFQTALVSDQNQEQNSENLDSDALNYAAVNFRPKLERSRGPVVERELDAHVVYAATRKTQTDDGSSSQ